MFEISIDAYDLILASMEISNFKADVLKIEICWALFDIGFVISIFELTKRPGPVKKFHGEVRAVYL